MKTAATPTATAARASGAINSACPPEAAPSAAGNCTEWLASNTTGYPVRAMIVRPRMSLTSMLYPKLVPRSVSRIRRLPVLSILPITLPMSAGAMNWPFLTLIAAPVRPAANSRSVWRDSNAGICRTSATSAAAAHWAGSCTSVRVGQPTLSRTRPSMASPGPIPGPRAPAMPERLALSKLALNTKPTPWVAQISASLPASISA